MKEVDLARAYRTIPSGLFLITTARDGKPNVQFAFRGLGIWETPPLVLVGVQRSNYSHETIEQTREFVVNICGEGQIAAINAKMREVANTITGRKAPEAVDYLGLIPRKSARLIAKTLKSAIANAENNNNLSADSLIVKFAIPVSAAPASFSSRRSASPTRRIRSPYAWPRTLPRSTGASRRSVRSSRTSCESCGSWSGRRRATPRISRRCCARP